MIFKKLVLFKLLISAVILNGQTDFRPGYVIQNSGDTLFGKIDYRSDIIMNSKCKFKNNENIIIEYSPKDIFAYRIIDGKYYISKAINNNTYFLEFLIKGKVNT